MKKYSKNQNETYYPQLPAKHRDAIEELCIEAIEDCQGWKSPEVEQIEYMARDGFSPFSHNHGGITINQFTDLQGIVGSGMYPSHKGARADIELQYNYNIELVAEQVFEEFEDLLKKHDILNSGPCQYHDIQDRIDQGAKDLKPVLRRIEDLECKYLSGEQSSIMYEVQFMYHGTDENGVHMASVSCAVNTEGPYHRRSISWAKDVFCEGAKELEVEWRTLKELKTKLKKALDTCASEVF